MKITTFTTQVCDEGIIIRKLLGLDRVKKVVGIV